MNVVLASGYFDPIHVGHLEYLELAKKLGDKLIVIINNNKQCMQKKGKAFMNEDDRMSLVKSLQFVDDVFLSIDTDSSVRNSIEHLAKEHKVTIFAKGGDRYSYEIPEGKLCYELGIEIVDGLGKKIRNSRDYYGK